MVWLLMARPAEIGTSVSSANGIDASPAPLDEPKYTRWTRPAALRKGGKISIRGM